MKPKAIPREKRLAIQRFVQEHSDCSVMLGERWRAFTVYVRGYQDATVNRLLVGRPRTEEAARALQDRVATFVRALQ